MCTSSERREWISVAVVKPIGTSLHADANSQESAQTQADRCRERLVRGDLLTFRQDLVRLGLAYPLDRA